MLIFFGIITRWEKPNAPTTPTFITMSRILPIFTYFDTLITNIMYQMYHLFFRKLPIIEKIAHNKKYISGWGLQIIFGIFFEILHIGWDKRQKPWFSWGFYGFYHENRLVGNFLYNIRISASKYVNMRSSKKIREFTYSELHPNLFINFDKEINDLGFSRLH